MQAIPASIPVQHGGSLSTHCPSHLYLLQWEVGPGCESPPFFLQSFLSNCTSPFLTTRLQILFCFAVDGTHFLWKYLVHKLLSLSNVSLGEEIGVWRNYSHLFQPAGDFCDQKVHAGSSTLGSLPLSFLQRKMCIHNHCTVSDRFSIQQSVVSALNSCCIKLCSGLLQPCQFCHITKILVIEKYSSSATAVGESCLHEAEAGLKNVSRHHHVGLKGDDSSENSNEVHLLHICGNAVPWGKFITGWGVVKHTHLGSQFRQCATWASSFFDWTTYDLFHSFAVCVSLVVKRCGRTSADVWGQYRPFLPCWPH